MSAIPEPSLDEGERTALEKAIAEFNAGAFFECHDTLEEMWSGLRGPSRDFFQGLIQVAVAFYHLDNRNLAGAESLFSRALKRLSKYPGRYAGFDLDAHRAEIALWRERIRAASIDELGAGGRPRWRFERLP